jgi:hypothetical protein
MAEEATVQCEAVALLVAGYARADAGEGNLLPYVDLELAVDEQRHRQVRNGLVRKHLGGRRAELHRGFEARPVLESALRERTTSAAPPPQFKISSNPKKARKPENAIWTRKQSTLVTPSPCSLT